MGQFVVSFSGSLGFVPHATRPLVRVLLPLDPHGWQKQREAETGPIIVPPHKAFMKFKMSSLADGSPRQPNFIYQEGGIQYGICFLGKESLTLPDSPDRLTLDETPIENPKNPSPDDRGSLSWIANMGKFCDTERLNTRYLDARTITDDHSPIAAIVDIVAGHMQTREVSKEVCTVRPLPDRGVFYQQRLAEEVDVSSGVAAGVCEIGSKGKDSKGKDSLLLRQENNGTTCLEIFNEVLDDILLPEDYRRPKSPVDYDFELLYKLTDLGANLPDHRHLPSLLGVPAHGTTGCKPGMFAPQAF